MNWKNRYLFKIGDRVKFISYNNLMCDGTSKEHFLPSPWKKGNSVFIGDLCFNKNGEQLFLIKGDDYIWHRIKDIRRI